MTNTKDENETPIIPIQINDTHPQLECIYVFIAIRVNKINRKRVRVSLNVVKLKATTGLQKWPLSGHKFPTQLHLSEGKDLVQHQ